MIYKYELACKEAGLSEEKTAEIRKFFDAEKKRLKRRNQAIEETDFHYFSMNHANDSGKVIYDNDPFGLDGYEFGDPDADTEMEAIRRWELDKLREYMMELPVDDREFLYACFEEERGAETRIAKKLGIPRTTVQYRKKKLIEELRKKFMGDF